MYRTYDGTHIDYEDQWPEGLDIQALDADLYVCYTDHTTQVMDEEGDILFSLPSKVPPAQCEVIARIYFNAIEEGIQRGRGSLACDIKRLLDL